MPKDLLQKSGGKLTEAEAREKATAGVAEESATVAKTALNFWDSGAEKDPVQETCGTGRVGAM